ncbi:MAG: hypothetical protein JRI25_12015 [Deltaproteobacteria bacterium]|nr:hypothetical protein [Deltaproteobacteria bacterium]
MRTGLAIGSENPPNEDLVDMPLRDLLGQDEFVHAGSPHVDQWNQSRNLEELTGFFDDSPSADLDLYLQYKSKGKWRTAASSKTGGFESIDYTVPSNRDGTSYRWEERHRIGTPSYCLTDSL